jgi:hypothetical protein
MNFYVDSNLNETHVLSADIQRHLTTFLFILKILNFILILKKFSHGSYFCILFLFFFYGEWGFFFFILPQLFIVRE